MPLKSNNLKISDPIPNQSNSNQISSNQISSNQTRDDSRVAKKSKKSRAKYIAIIVGVIVVLLTILAVVIFIIKRKHGKRGHGSDGSLRITFDDWYFMKFKPSLQDIEWASHDGTDSYFHRKDGVITQYYLNNTSRKFLIESQVQKSNGGPFDFYDYSVSPDLKYILFTSTLTERWRHSYFANYWIYEIRTKKLTPLIQESPNIEISYATWGPTGHSLAYVYQNNLYIKKNMGNAKQITFDGSDSIFNGIPDWVYEEEVLSSNYALWWSPDSKYLCFMRTDDTHVNNFSLPFYTEDYMFNAPTYPRFMTLKYPRVGSKNPVVSLHLVNLDNFNTTKLSYNDTLEDAVITEVAWVGKHSILAKQVDRDSDYQRVFLFNVSTFAGKLIRTLNATEIGVGWFDPSSHVTWVPENRKMKRYGDGYVEIAVNEGYNHIAYYSSFSASPKFLTKGDWEVVSISAFDSDKGHVYFIGTHKNSLERHLYRVSLSGNDMIPITDVEKEGFYYVDFSPTKSSYLLIYMGPEVPWQSIRRTDDNGYEYHIEKNQELSDELKGYTLPKKIFYQLKVGNYVMNAMEQRPPDFDDTGATKYPVLFHVYGGPSSQLVSKRYGVSWNSFLASDPDLKCIIVSVDGRGTGYMGKKFLSEIRGRLGMYETLDQLEVAKEWRKKKYVDKNRFAIWGWSYGGYLTLKVLEKATGLFQYGISVAPATDFRYYDTIFTERYMGEFSKNVNGYRTSSITYPSGFKNATRFLIMHGSGDENVHVQHTLAFVEKLIHDGVTNYDMHIFPDSAHNIAYRNAHYVIYMRMTEWLREAFKKK
ncbi:hypothetical protein PORY_000524 [Pneumocystis oryctolagi]|uniref:Uncharacterized protein n=1 Tax=Pneumocystis oryctolagi TaxID=42067 RepID=A0ACB7CFZ2_9ASCO|nr:hypothetical protein PORY_000524 [Pneumocystis oryctolagi]